MMPRSLSSCARFWPLLLLALAIAAAWRLGVADKISFPELARRQDDLRLFVASRPFAAPALYVGLYAAAVALSLPGGAVLTCAGGLLFGTWFGGALAAVGATAGAVLLFLIARTALGPLMARHARAVIGRIRPGLERDGFSYLLALRLIPAFPFWLVNLAPALVGMRLAPYAAATALGILPATFVFASIGAGLSTVLATGRSPDLSLILAPAVLGPLVALALLSLLPIAWRRWKPRHG
ncbi:MAG TPA: VTT domain-containing protein [Acetobacteraceae bacterium]|nr:VTT domain-containing protein [Acetobacteraceae bacterium]